MRILIIGLKKRSASQLDKQLGSAGFSIALSGDGGASLDSPDLVVVNPDATTDEEQDLLREIAGRSPGLPILLLSDGNERSSYYRDLGFSSQILREPYSVDDLSAKIREILPVVPEQGARVLRAGDLSFDLETRVITVDEREGESVVLTPKEMALFEYLLRHPNQVLARSALLKDVWGYDFDTETNVVDVYVRYLREKLGTLGKKDLIETVRGAGYRLLVLSPVQAQSKRARELSIVTWTGVMASVLLAAGLFITYLTGNIAVQRSQGPNFEQIALQTAKKTDAGLEKEIALLRDLSISPDIRRYLKAGQGARVLASNQRSEVDSHIREVIELRRSLISDITVVSASGRMLASTTPNVPAVQAKMAWFQKGNALPKGEVAVTDITYLDGRPVMDLFTPVFDNGRRLGALKMTMELRGLFSSIATVGVGKTGHTMLIDSKGVVVICPIFAPRSHQLAKPLMDSIVAKSSGSQITDHNPHGGFRSIAGFAAVENPSVRAASASGDGKSGWYILLTQNPHETYAHVYTSLWRAFALGLFAVVGITYLAYLVSRRVIRPGRPRRR